MILRKVCTYFPHFLKSELLCSESLENNLSSYAIRKEKLKSHTKTIYIYKTHFYNYKVILLNISLFCWPLIYSPQLLSSNTQSIEHSGMLNHEHYLRPKTLCLTDFCLLKCPKSTTISYLKPPQRTDSYGRIA